VPIGRKRAPTKTSGQGRPAGIPNKITRDVKEMILGALSGVGGQKYLEEQAIANPNAFMVLVGKVLPLQVSGEGGGPMILKLIKFGDGDAG
jgi:hypothetical protein